MWDTARRAFISFQFKVEVFIAVTHTKRQWYSLRDIHCITIRKGPELPYNHKKMRKDTYQLTFPYAILIKKKKKKKEDVLCSDLLVSHCFSATSENLLVCFHHFLYLIAEPLFFFYISALIIYESFVFFPF